MHQALGIDIAAPLPLAGATSASAAAVFSSIRMIGREAWNTCFAGEIETYDYLLAVEEAGLDGFGWHYVVVREGGEILSAMPVFLCHYALETTLEGGRIRQAIERVRRVFDGFLKFRLACLGSPCTEAGLVGFHPRVAAERQPALFGALLDAFEAHASANGCALTAFKDLPLPSHLQSTLLARGYSPIGSMPTAWLDIDFDTIEAYLGTLSPGTRKDMRRKLRSRDSVRIEYTTDFGPLLPRVMELYRETRARSEWQFEALTGAYFDGILKRMPDNAFCVFYFVGDELLAANLLVHDGDHLIDKFFCMDAEAGRPYNLYYLSWFTNLDYCLRHGLSRYQSGQAYYRNKVRLGSQLTENALFFRHRNPLMQVILRWVSEWIAADGTDEHPA